MDGAWKNLLADGTDLEKMFGDLYAELKQMARAKVAYEKPGITLNATALVHEAWLRLEKSAPAEWRDRSQFFASASEAMRRILVEAARRRSAAKRGGGMLLITLDGNEIPMEVRDSRVIEVHEALERLETEDPTKAQIVKLRFFCGFENEEIAAAMGVNEKTVRRHWEVAKVWLYRAVRDDS